MIRMFTFYKRHPGTSYEHFCEKWTELGEMVRSSPEIGGRMKRYVQHRVAPPEGPLPPGHIPFEYDGFAEVWYESMEVAQDLYDDPVFKEKFYPYEAAFLDFTIEIPLTPDTPVTQIGQEIRVD